MPWPMRFGPAPRITTRGPARRRRPRSPARRSSSGTGVRAGNSPAHVSTVLKTGRDAERVAVAAHRRLGRDRERPRAGRRTARAASRGAARARRSSVESGRPRNAGGLLDDLGDLVDEPRVDAGSRRPPRRRSWPASQRPLHQVQPALGRRPPSAASSSCRGLRRRSSEPAAEVEPGLLDPPPRLAERLLERAADRHHLADGLHRGREARIGLGELLEGEPRHLHDDVVERRLERGRRLARDVVRDLVEPVADGEQRGDLRDREPGGLRGERARARHARVHLDQHLSPGRRIDGELHVRAARLDPDHAQHLQRRVAHPLVLAVGERLLRRHGDRVARCARPSGRRSRSSTR